MIRRRSLKLRLNPYDRQGVQPAVCDLYIIHKNYGLKQFVLLEAPGLGTGFVDNEAG